MECGEYEWRADMARGPSTVGLKLKFPSERGVPLAPAARVSRQPARAAALEQPPATHLLANSAPQDCPFMSDMDEITYWIYTKRAPCLMNYDNLFKKQSEEAQCSKTMIDEAPTPRKRKKKRKLSMLDEDSMSTEKQQNVYFEVSQNEPALNSCNSDSIGSDVDFNIKNASMEKPKKRRVQKNNRAKIHKKTKVVTSTPKAPVNLRRSLRQAQQSTTNAHLNNSYEVFNNQISNGHVETSLNLEPKPVERVNKATEMSATGDGNQISESKKSVMKTNSKTPAQPNGQFEDMSDVSGFTANYIRSTKVQSSKTPKKIRCKSSRNLAKESQQRDNNMVVCVNKSMNTGVPGNNVLNCSTDSENVINLVTTRSNDKPGRTDKTTSVLKFVDSKNKNKQGNRSGKLKNKSDLNISFQSQSSAASRYPKRYKNHTDAPTDNEINIRTRSASKNCLEYNNSDKKENPDAILPRTRSGRNTSLAARDRENSVLVVSNSTEQMSSMVSMNVAGPTLAETKKRRSTRQLRSTKPDKSGNALRRDSLRDKSGFTACFSESEDDSVPLGQRKYFCN